MKITWYGTVAISIETEYSKILFDPFVPISGSRVKVDQKDFEGYSHIFLTHGHLDHICSIPELLTDNNTGVWCTKTSAATLGKKGVGDEKIHIIQPEDRLELGEMKLQALQGKHIIFDNAYVKKVLLSPRMLRYFYNLPWLLYQNNLCQENGETLAYVMKAEEKTILLLGSLGMDPNAVYPGEVDLLILPFQGASDLVTPSLEIIEKIRPKRILVDHFDDTFPPISNTISLDQLKKRMAADHPDIEVIVPKYKSAVHL